jgi:DNA primase
MTNFVLLPLFHLRDRNGESKRLAVIHCPVAWPDKLIELPNKAFSSADKFDEIILDQGYSHTKDSFGKTHLKRLFAAIGNSFPIAHELRNLGWQKDGFWSFSNAIYDGENVLQTDKNGIVLFKNQHFYSPSASQLYKSDRTGEDGEEVTESDPYINDKHLAYKESPVSFSRWAQHMMKMHDDAGMPLICFAFFSIFKDIVNRYEKSPLLYGYGLVQSGKSTWAEGAFYLFHTAEAKPFNLNQGTVYSYWNRMDRSKNIIELFNEFDEDAIEEEYYRGFKGSYDGEGRERGSGVKNKTETQQTNCAVIIAGQTLSTKDGASVLIRSIPVHFPDPGERTTEAKDLYDEWMGWTQKGMTSCIIDILKHRKLVRENFITTFNEELKLMKQQIKDAGENFKERIAKNHCIILSLGKLMLQQMDLGFTYQQLSNWCRNNVVTLSRMISEVDNLAIFWKTIAYLYEKGELQEGVDFKVVTETHVRKTVEREDITINFDKPTHVLYIRLTKAFPLFQREFRQTHGKTAINEGTLLTYFRSSKPYIGSNPGSWFKEAEGKKSKNTSSHMFDYEKLNIKLVGEDIPQEDNRRAEIFTAQISKLPELIDVGATAEKIMFSVKQYKQFDVPGGLPQTKAVYTKCFCNDVSLKDQLFIDSKVYLEGMVDEKLHAHFQTPVRTMEVEILKLSSSMTEPKTEENIF